MLEHLRAKATEERRSISDVIHEGLSVLFDEDAEDIMDFDTRIAEPSIDYNELFMV